MKGRGVAPPRRRGRQWNSDRAWLKGPEDQIEHSRFILRHIAEQTLVPLGQFCLLLQCQQNRQKQNRTYKGLSTAALVSCPRRTITLSLAGWVNDLNFPSVDEALSQGFNKLGVHSMNNEFRRVTQQIENGVPGFTSPQVLSFLSDLILWKRPDNAIEIGSYMGRSSMVIATAMMQIGAKGKLLCVDLFTDEIDDKYVHYPVIKEMASRIGSCWDQYMGVARPTVLRAYFDKTMSRFPYLEPHIEVHQGASEELSLPTERRFQFAYLDGDHTFQAVTIDLIKTLKNLDPGGVVAFDDCSDQFPGVQALISRLGDLPGATKVGEQFPDVAFSFSDPVGSEAILSAIGQDEFFAVDGQTSFRGKK
jgi:predicted O-methyltransferase YrrM